MTPNIEDILSCRATLQAEVQLLKKKVENGSTLRAGERKFLLALLEPVDNEIAQLRGAYHEWNDPTKKMCSKCREKIAVPFLKGLKARAYELGWNI